MPFQKGHAKHGGRKASGVPLVQIRREVADKLQELGFDPITRLVQLATDEGCHPDRAARICCELAKYVWPQRKAVEHTGAGGGSIAVSLSLSEVLSDIDAELEAIASRATGEPAIEPSSVYPPETAS